MGQMTFYLIAGIETISYLHGKKENQISTFCHVKKKSATNELKAFMWKGRTLELLK